jgi:acyl carrier protein
MAKLLKKEISSIKKDLINYLKIGNPLISELKKLPLNKSLLEVGLIDSFGVIEIVIYIEKKYKIKIKNDELTKAKFGSINKMVKLIFLKIK